MGDFPMMTETARSSSTAPSASSSRSWCARRASTSPRRKTPPRAAGSIAAKLIPNRGAWLEFETSNRDVLSVKVDRKRKMPVTILLRALGYGDGRATARALHRRRHQRASPLHRRHARQGADEGHDGREEGARRGADRTLQAPPPRRPADAGERREPAEEPLLQPAPLRPREGRALQAEQAARRSTRRNDTRVLTQRGHHRDRHDDDPAEQRRGRAGRHRPPRQPPHPRGRRADPDAVPRRPRAHGARRQGAHDDSGPGDGDAERADQHPPGGGGGARVLRRQSSSRSSWTRRTRWPS